MNLKKYTIHYSYEDEAVSEIISTLLLVTMAVVMFSAIVIMVLNPWTNYSDDSPPTRYDSRVCSRRSCDLRTSGRGQS